MRTVAKRKAVVPGDPKRAVAYLRVSTEKQDLGPEAQRDQITAFAARENVVVVSWHEDRLAGDTPLEDRPGFLAALDSLRQQGAGLLLIAKRDRLARSVVIDATAQKLVENAGGHVVSADGVANGDRPEDELLRSIMAALASYEKALIRSRTRAALGALKARGRKYARHAPLGYRVEGDKLVADPAEQRVIARVKKLRESGLSYERIVHKLTAEKVRLRGGLWSVNRLRRIVTGKR